jgi:hypothetical protein
MIDVIRGVRLAHSGVCIFVVSDYPFAHSNALFFRPLCTSFAIPPPCFHDDLALSALDARLSLLCACAIALDVPSYFISYHPHAARE